MGEVRVKGRVGGHVQILGSPAHSTLLFFWLFGLVWEKPLVTPSPQPQTKKGRKWISFPIPYGGSSFLNQEIWSSPEAATVRGRKR